MALDVDVRREATVGIPVLDRAEGPFDGNEGPDGKVLLSEVGVSSPECDFVPVGPLLIFAVNLLGGDADIEGAGFTVRELFAGQVDRADSADERYAVDRTHHSH